MRRSPAERGDSIKGAVRSGLLLAATAAIMLAGAPARLCRARRFVSR